MEAPATPTPVQKVVAYNASGERVLTLVIAMDERGWIVQLEDQDGVHRLRYLVKEEDAAFRGFYGRIARLALSGYRVVEER
jgi:hypothetical protein